MARIIAEFLLAAAACLIVAVIWATLADEIPVEGHPQPPEAKRPPSPRASMSGANVPRGQPISLARVVPESRAAELASASGPQGPPSFPSIREPGNFTTRPLPPGSAVPSTSPNPRPELEAARPLEKPPEPAKAATAPDLPTKWLPDRSLSSAQSPAARGFPEVEGAAHLPPLWPSPPVVAPPEKDTPPQTPPPRPRPAPPETSPPPPEPAPATPGPAGKVAPRPSNPAPNPPEPAPPTVDRTEKGAPRMANLREHFVKHGGLDRRYVTYTPRDRDPSRPMPVVLAFHGGMGQVETLMIQSRLNASADRHGFLLVYPEGTGRSKLLTFNAGTCCGFAARSGVDDVGFVRAILDELPTLYPVDPRRVYATGMSNGAMLCYRLACEMPERIAAIGPVSGGMTVEGPRPSRPVPVIHFHGMQDRNVPFAGGIGPSALQTVFHKPVAEVIAWWVDVDRCSPEPVEVRRERDFVMTRYEPRPGTPGAPVVLFALPEGGHNWPGGIDITAHLGTGPLVRSVDATELIWRFFEQFKLDRAPAADR